MENKQVPQLECICGKPLQPVKASSLMKQYETNVGVTCTYCTNLYEGDYMMYACDALHDSKHHPNGYGFCNKCADNIHATESKQESNKPKHDQLLLQRTLNSMILAEKHCHLLNENTNNYRLLLQNLRTLARIEGMTEYKLLQKLKEEQTKEMNEKLEQLVFYVLDIEQQYNRLKQAIEQNTNEKHLIELRKFIGYCKYAILRMKEIKKLHVYYDKFKQLENNIDNKINTQSEHIYCICGRQLLEMNLIDTEFGAFNCAICYETFECVGSQNMFQCEMLSCSIFHNYAFTICPKCIDKMSPCIKRDFKTDEIIKTENDRKKETEDKKRKQQAENEKNKNEEKEKKCEEIKLDEKKIVLEEYNKNLMIIALHRYDRMDVVLSNVQNKDEKENEEITDTKKWQKLCDIFFNTMNTFGPLDEFFTESDKDILTKRKTVIENVMKRNMPLCYCGNVLTSVKAQNAVDCHLCLKQEFKGIINVCLLNNKCKYWKNKYYLCEMCGDKIRYRPKEFVLEQRIVNEILESIEFIDKNNDDEKK
eukprot:163197_1